MEIDPQVARALGFPKTKYAWVERERRWLCRQAPRALIVSSEAITDLYVTGARLRLREARPLDGGAPMLRLTRKADVSTDTRLITSIYLPPEEFAILAAALEGPRIRKLRHRLRPVNGQAMSVDEFQGELSGLVMAEAEFETAEQMAAFPSPDFAIREVTHDQRYSGGQLVRYGTPAEP
jgi:CYTH domain-containing protein